MRVVIEGDARGVQAAAREAKAALRGLGTETTALSRRGGALSAMASRQRQTLADLGRTARSTGTLIGGALVLGIAAAARSGISFEKEMSRVKAVTEATGREMAGLNSLAIQLGRDTKFSAGEAASGMYELATAGFKVKDVQAAIPGVLSLAAASNIELADAAEIAANAVKGFGLDADQATHVADVMAAAVNRSSLEMVDLQYSMKYVGPIAESTGLSFESIIAALGELGDAGIKGEQGGTTLRGGLLQLVKPTAQVSKGLKQLGLDASDLYGPKGLKPLPELVGLLDAGTKKLTASERNAALTRIFGKEAATGWMKIIRQGPGELAKFTRALEHSDGTAKKAAKTMQDNVAGSFEQLKGSAETVSIVLFKKFSPTLKRALDGATKDVNEFMDALKRDPGFESGDDIFGAIKRAFDKSTLGEDIEKAFRDARLGDRLADVVSAAAPKIAEGAAKAAPKAVQAFFDAFRGSNLWGKLIVGGFLLHKLGGFAAFRAIGRRAGAEFGQQVASQGASSAAAGMTASRWGRVGAQARAIGKGVLWTQLALGIADGATSGGDVQQRVLNALSTITLGLSPSGDDVKQKAIAKGLGEIDRRVKALSGQGNVAGLKRLNDELRRHGGFVDRGNKLWGRFQIPKEALEEGRKRIEAATKSTQTLTENFDFLSRGGASDMSQLRRTVTSSMSAISAAMEKESAEGRRHIDRTFRAAIRNVRKLMDEGVLTTEVGTRKIFSLMDQAAKALGVPANKRYFIKRGQAVPPRLAKGGMLPVGQPGEPGRDSVPMELGGQKVVVAPGETIAVLTRHQRAELEARTADVGGLGGFFSKHDRPNYMATGGIVGLGQQLIREGYQVGEHPAFGGVGGGHAPTGYHPRGMAIDVNADGRPGGEAAWLDRLHARLKNMPGVVELLWRVAGHFDHLHVAMSGSGGALGGAVAQLARVIVGGPDSALKPILQASLDKTRGFAQDRLEELAGSVEGSEFGTSATGSGMELMQQISKERGWNFGDWWELDRRESSHGQNLANPTSTARLRGQFLSMNYGKYGPGSDPRQNPTMDQQIISMAQYIQARYGNPSRALAFHRANNWYEQGGLIGSDGGSIADLIFAATGMPPTGTGGSEQKGSRAQAKPRKKRSESATALARRWTRRSRRDPKLKLPALGNLPQLEENYHKLVARVQDAGGLTDLIGLARRRFESLGGEYLVDHDEDPDTPDVVNQSGLQVGRRWIPGIDQAVERLNEVMRLHGDVWANKIGQRTIVTRALEILNEAIDERTKLWRKLRDQVAANARRIKSVKTELRTLGKKKKPTGADRSRKKRLTSELADLHKAQRTLAGDDEPDPSGYKVSGDGPSGGALAAVHTQLGGDTGYISRRDELKDKPATIGIELQNIDLDIGDLRREMFDITGTQPPKPDRAAGTADLLKDLQLEALQGQLRAQAGEIGVLRSLRGLMPTLDGLGGFDRGGILGAFAHGIQHVPRDGIALLHAGEMVAPAAEGPYGNQLRPYGPETSARGARQPAPVVSVTIVNDPTGMVRVARAEIEGHGVQVISRRLGRDSRQFRVAPGP